MRNGIIIPCYNEASRLDLEAFDLFIRNHPDYAVCFVNDGSSDATLEMLNEFREGRECSVFVHDLPENCGKAEAVRRGVNYMIDSIPVNTIGFMDADLSTGFEDYKVLVDQLQDSKGGLEMAFGSRSAQGAEEIQRNPFRKIMSFIVRTMVLCILRLPIRDTQCGAKVFSIPAARHCFSKGFVSRWLFDVELFIRMKDIYPGKAVMQKLKEIPLKKWVHMEGSKITLNDSLQVPTQLLKIASSYYIVPGMGRSARAASVVLAILMQTVKP